MTDVTAVLNAVHANEPGAADRLLPLVYDELRRLAARKIANEQPGQTLDATALVHEAYVRLVHLAPGDSPGAKFDNHRHFFAAAAEAMRRILIDNARRKHSVKHGGGRTRVPLDEAHRITETPEGLLELDEALTRFAAHEPAKAELVKLRFFAGLPMLDAASALGISIATAERWWAFARVSLLADLSE